MKEPAFQVGLMVSISHFFFTNDFAAYFAYEKNTKTFLFSYPKLPSMESVFGFVLLLFG